MKGFYVVKNQSSYWKWHPKLPFTELFQCKYIYVRNWNQTGPNKPNGSEYGQTGQIGPNKVKKGSNSLKLCKTGSNSANLSQLGPNRENLDMSLYMIDEKLKLNKEIKKNIIGTRLKFEIHGIGFKVRHIDWRLCSTYFPLLGSREEVYHHIA